MSNYAQIIKQIEELQRQAEKARKEELSSVVKAIKNQIADYSITAEDLGLSSSGGAKRGRRPGKASAKLGRKPPGRKSGTKRPNAGIKVVPKYRDDAGNTWTGRGKQPKWVVAALAMGRSLDSMLIR